MPGLFHLLPLLCKEKLSVSDSIQTLIALIAQWGVVSALHFVPTVPTLPTYHQLKAMYIIGTFAPDYAQAREPASYRDEITPFYKVRVDLSSAHN